MEFLTKHFVALSALIIASASVLAMVFLTSYLGTFDWNLVWLIEYSDLAKFGLMAVAVITPLLSLLYNQIDAVRSWVSLNQKGSRNLVIFIVAITLLVAVWDVYFDITHKTGRATFDVMYAVSILLILSAAAFAFWMLKNIPERPNWKNTAPALFFSTCFLLAVTGNTFGYYVRDVSTERSDVITKNETFTNVRIIMMLSHHVVFLTDQRVTIVPTVDIIKIISTAAKSALQRMSCRT
jgi:hypothetical protein